MDIRAEHPVDLIKKDESVTDEKPLAQQKSAGVDELVSQHQIIVDSNAQTHSVTGQTNDKLNKEPLAITNEQTDEVHLSSVPKTSPFDLLADYSAYSTIHGVRYFSDSQRHWSERLWWLITFSATVLICGYLIVSTYMRWQENPVVVSFGTAPAPVWEFPFPAITVCPNARIFNQTQFNYTERMSCSSNHSCIWIGNEFAQMKAAVQVCQNSVLLDNYGDSDKNLTEIIRRLAPTVSQVFETCRFDETDMKCDEIFHEILTDKGLCYTFNMLSGPEFISDKMSNDHTIGLDHGDATANWDPDTMMYSGEPLNRTITYRPQRVTGVGGELDQNGFGIRLRLPIVSMDKQCAGPLHGYTILLHAPDQYPNMVKNYLTVGTQCDVKILAKPKMVLAAPEIASYHPEQRQCFFNGERKLRFFNLYNQNNCELECLSEYVVKHYKCVPFYMPRNQSTPICNQLQSEQVKVVVGSFFDGFLAFQFRSKCDCLPSCNFIRYEADMRVIKDPKLIDNNTLFTTVSISFAENEFITSKRSELSGKLEFLASCGGFLGLFMGISLLSIAELVYFFSLRLMCNVFAAKDKPIEPII